jgi:hypothetical protein
MASNAEPSARALNAAKSALPSGVAYVGGTAIRRLATSAA